jgi:hypothetical protein
VAAVVAAGTLAGIHAAAQLLMAPARFDARGQCCLDAGGEDLAIAQTERMTVNVERIHAAHRFLFRPIGESSTPACASKEVEEERHGECSSPGSL